MALKFYWNGIKASDGKLQRASLDDGPLKNFPAGTITICARDYSGFDAEVAFAFVVTNDSDLMTDYFDHDRIRVEPSHPLYEQVAQALAKSKAHSKMRGAKYDAKVAAAHARIYQGCYCAFCGPARQSQEVC